jgi:acetyltransferase-like isoleucine patch superfamily enzyme
MGELIMGKRTYGHVIRRGAGNSVTIGKYCSLAAGLIIDGGFGHNTEFITTYPFNVMFDECKELTGHPVWKGDVTIGNDVWIGEDCLIMSGVTIGDGAVIGARSIVTKNIDPYSINVGAPTRKVKQRFTDEQISDLLKIKWWDWEEDVILENSHLLMSKDIQQFIDKHKIH